MKSITSITVFSLLFILMMGCKSNSLVKTAPFEIQEKVFFYWENDQEGKKGNTIRLTGISKSLNLSFSKVFFHNHEYSVVPEFNGNGFVIEGTNTKLIGTSMTYHRDPAEEYGNTATKPANSIPFDLKEDEAVLVYSVNGKEGYYNINGITELEKVSRP